MTASRLVEPLEEEFDARVGAVMFDYNQEAV